MANEGGGTLSKFRKYAKDILQIADRASGDNRGENELVRADGLFPYDHVTVSSLLGTARRQARSRSEIYLKYHYMLGDPVISSALRLHVTSALGGDDATGNTVFVEELPDTEKSKEMQRYVEEIRRDLEPLFNRIAHSVAFNAAGFGDAYGRVWSKEGEGVQDIDISELVFPPLVQPYERGNRTEGYMITTGPKFKVPMRIDQMVRMKLPRMVYVPQSRVIEKVMRSNLETDDYEELQLLPALVGGSFLDAAEESYDFLQAALRGMVGQRILSSMDENILAVNMEGMTLKQRDTYMKSIKAMLKSIKTYAEEQVNSGSFSTERRFHIIPTFAEKQVTSVSQFNGTSGGMSINVDDVLFHAKMLSGALGVDLSMLGFADLLSGGLGEGGFFRTSAQAAERSRIIRNALSQCLYDIVDIHTLRKWGFVFTPEDRPFKINFYGSISALESEKQNSKERSANAAAITMSVLSQLRELGLPQDVNKQIFEKMMEMDTDMAELIAKGMANAKPPQDGGDGDGFGGGFGGPGTFNTPDNEEEGA